MLKLDFTDYSQELMQTIAGYMEVNLGISHEKIKSDDLRLDLTAMIAQYAAALQPEGEKLFFGTRIMGEGSYYALVQYEEEEAGIEAADSACDLAEDFLMSRSPRGVEELRSQIREIYMRAQLGPSTDTIVEAARKRDIPVNINGGGFVVLGQGKYQKRISASICETTSNIGVEVAGDKELTKRLLAEAMIPVPKGVTIRRQETLKDLQDELGYPLVTKPLNGNQGKGITSDITEFSTLEDGFRAAKAISEDVIVEKHIHGNDYRLLVVDFKLVAAAKRIPASVTGNGSSTIQQLIDEVNSDPKRGEGHGSTLTRIRVDEAMHKLLESKGLTINSVPEKDVVVHLKDTANLSTGGTAIDVTDDVHPENALLAERVARIIGLNICGIDIIAPDLSTPISQNGGAVLEVNAAPGLRMHAYPSVGTPRDVGGAIVELIFPEGARARLPIIAITGTNGKTTTTRLMAYVTGEQGYTVGFTTTDGIYLNNTRIFKGDCSGPASTRAILNETVVDYAVLECARGGIIRSGLAFDKCNVAIVTNVAADHLGIKDINTVEDLANVKAVVPQSVMPDGYAILNASDDLVYAMKDKLKCNIGLFSIDHKNKRIKEHVKAGGIAVVMDENKDIVILKGKKKIVVENVMNIPLTIEGKADFMIENVMPVALAAYVQGFNIEKVRTALRTFTPSSEQTPGRFNKFRVNGVNVIIDYAHNPHGLQAMARFLGNINDQKIGIIAGVGDRRDDDIVEIGRISAEMYDEVIIRTDRDTRGRTPEEIRDFLLQGLTDVKSDIVHHFIPEAKDALEYAIKNAEKGAYIVISAEDVQGAINAMKELEKQFN